MKNHGEQVVRIEAEALRALADRIAGPMADDFNRALEILDRCAGRVVVTGMGESGRSRGKWSLLRAPPAPLRCTCIRLKPCTAT